MRHIYAALTTADKVSTTMLDLTVTRYCYLASLAKIQLS